MKELEQASMEHPMKRMAIVRTDRLGELVLSLAIAREVRERWPTTNVTMVVMSGMEPLIQLCPDVDGVMTWSATGAWWQRVWSQARRWRQASYDAIVIVNPKKELHLAGALAGIPMRIGYARKWGRYLLTHALTDNKTAETKHELEWHAQLLELLGMHRALSSPRLTVPEDQRQAMERRLAEAGIGPSERVVAMHPWASTTRKRWPTPSFLETARRIEAAGRARAVMIGSAEHQGAIPLAGSSCLDWTGRTSLVELAVLLGRSACLLSNDSGPVHLAAAVGTPVVALFGTADAGSHPARWGPCGDGHTVIHKPLEEISVEEVAATVRRYL